MCVGSCGMLLAVSMVFACQAALADNDDWIDPSDMFNYVSSSHATATKESKNPSDAEESNREEYYILREQKRALELQLFNCQQEKENIGMLIETPPTSNENRRNMAHEGVFFRQYVKSLTLNIDSDGGTYRMQVALSSEDVAVLQTFANSAGHVEDAHEVLSSMLDHMTRLVDPHHLSLRERIENYIGIDLDSLCKIMAVLLMTCLVFSLLLQMRFVSLRQWITRLSLALFIVSIPWNWWHLYKKALSKRHASLLQDQPSQCRSSEQSATESLYQWVISALTFNSDECAKYYEKLLIDPLWEVPPTLALAVTVTKFLLEPLQHIGTSLSALVRGLLQDVPVFMWPVTILIAMSLIVFFLLLAFGYRVYFLWGMFGLTPGGQPSQGHLPPPAQPQGQLPPQAQPGGQLPPLVQPQGHLPPPAQPQGQQPPLAHPQLDMHQPDMHQPDMHQPDMHQPDMHQPDIHQPDMHQPDMPQPDMPQPDVPQLSAPQPSGLPVDMHLATQPQQLPENISDTCVLSWVVIQSSPEFAEEEDRSGGGDLGIHDTTLPDTLGLQRQAPPQPSPSLAAGQQREAPTSPSQHKQPGGDSDRCQDLDTMLPTTPPVSQDTLNGSTEQEVVGAHGDGATPSHAPNTKLELSEDLELMPLVCDESVDLQTPIDEVGPQ